MKKLICLLAAALLSQTALAGEKLCLRPAEVDQIRMTGVTTAVATDKHHRAFDIVFVGACGARHPNIHFVLKPELMPGCIGPGTALPTNLEGPCVAQTVKPRA